MRQKQWKEKMLDFFVDVGEQQEWHVTKLLAKVRKRKSVVKSANAVKFAKKNVLKKK